MWQCSVLSSMNALFQRSFDSRSIGFLHHNWFVVHGNPSVISFGFPTSLHHFAKIKRAFRLITVPQRPARYAPSVETATQSTVSYTANARPTTVLLPRYLALFIAPNVVAKLTSPYAVLLTSKCRQPKTASGRMRQR